MPEYGGAYLTSKNGILRIIIIVFGIIAFALVADSGYGGVVAWPFAAYLMAWLLSLILFFIIIVNLASKMQCGVSFEAVDFCISLLLFSFCLSGSIVLAVYNYRGGHKHSNERIAATVFGFLTTILYFVELYLHQADAPEPTKYATGINGIVKIVVITLGHATFVLLDAAGYGCGRNDPCTSGRNYALAAYVIAWSVTVIFFLLHITGLSEKIGKAFATADFVWAIFGILFCLTGSIVLACYLEGDTTGWSGSRRVAAVVFGFFTTIAYCVEAFLLKKSSGSLIVPST